MDFLADQPEGSVLGLSDIRGSVTSSQVIDLFKKSATSTAKYIKRQAVVGVTGFKGVFFDLIVRLSGQNARTFEDMEAAKDWLVQDRDQNEWGKNLTAIIRLIYRLSWRKSPKKS